MKIKIYLTFLLFVFASTFSFAQKAKAILYLKDSTKVIGLGELSGNSSLKFKKEGKIQFYKFKDIIKAEIFTNENEFKTYKSINIKGVKKPKIMEEVLNGKVSLYLHMVYGNSPKFNNGSPNLGGGLFKIKPVGIKNYYVKKDISVKAEHLGSTHLFSRKFKKFAAKFFNDCEFLVKKIRNKEFKKRDIKKVVEFYNKSCN